MFDSVGRNLDDEAAKRSAQSAVIMAIAVSCTAGVVVLAGMWTVREIIRDELEDLDIVQVEILEEDMEDLEAPPPPPPPPPPPSGPEPDDEEDDEEEEPDELDDQVQDLEEKVEDKIKDADKPKGVEGGVEGGQEGGVIGGVIGGVEGGVLGGKLGGTGGAKVVHHSQVEVKKRVDPRYPPAARGLGLSTQRCIATVEIDTQGVPTRVNVDSCPKVFHPSTEEALLKWRWYPYKIDGERVDVSTKIAVVYKETS